MTPPAEAEKSRTECGITDEDAEQIGRYLAKRPHERTVDDLRPAEDD